MTDSKRIILIRHGQTDWNHQRRWQGGADIPLNEEGIAQAEALADYLHETGEQIDVIVASDLKRAYATAQAIANKLGLTIETDPRLREIAVGAFEGLTGTEVQAQYADEYRRMREDYLNFVFPGGESRLAMQTRAYEALSAVLERMNSERMNGERLNVDTGAKTAAVVTHGGVIAMLLAKLFPNEEEISAKPIHNTSITTVKYGPEGWTLETLAITPHLPEF